MKYHHLFTELEQQQLRLATRKLIGAVSRMEGAVDTPQERTVWGCNRNYILGVLRQLEKQWSCPHKETK